MSVLEEMKKICAFLVITKLICTLEEGRKYEKYIDFVVELMVLFSFLRVGLQILHYLMR